ncbi:hypothetical protein BJY52DRAFT_1364133 [Lactarius psammicola]|nr:hypothetical protein BJY52DRAFT_1364133 [Lactarius psammicola]
MSSTPVGFLTPAFRRDRPDGAQLHATFWHESMANEEAPVARQMQSHGGGEGKDTGFDSDDIVPGYYVLSLGGRRQSCGVVPALDTFIICTPGWKRLHGTMHASTVIMNPMTTNEMSHSSSVRRSSARARPKSMPRPSSLSTRRLTWEVQTHARIPRGPTVLRARVTTAASQLPHHMDEKVQAIPRASIAPGGSAAKVIAPNNTVRRVGAGYANSREIYCSASLRTRRRCSSFSRLTGLTFDGIALMQFQETRNASECMPAPESRWVRHPADSDHAALRPKLTPSRDVHYSYQPQNLELRRIDPGTFYTPLLTLHTSQTFDYNDAEGGLLYAIWFWTVCKRCSTLDPRMARFADAERSLPKSRCRFLFVIPPNDGSLSVAYVSGSCSWVS